MSDPSIWASNLVVAPVAVPLLAGILLILTRRRVFVSQTIALLANFVGIVVALNLVHTVDNTGIVVLNFGEWKAPFGIVFAADMLSALMVLVTMVVSTATLFFATVSIDKASERKSFYALFQFLLMGINGSFLTGDLFNLFVWFEVLLVSSYGLMALGSGPYQVQETFKYLVINAVSSALFLLGLAAVYGATGTLNMADLGTKFAAIGDARLRSAIACVFLVVFGLKGGLFPLYFWMPRAYYAPPTVVSALFGGLLTKVGVYALFRVTSLMFAGNVDFIFPLLVWVAGCTMLFGVLGALAQWDFKRILSYHIASQIGYMIMGLGLWTPLALAGAIFYIVHHILVKTALFLIAATVEKLRGTTNLRKLGGVVETAPGMSFWFMVAGLSLAGAPPLSGFVAKLMLMRAGLEEASYGIVVVSVVVSFLTLFSMMKIFRYAFWRSPSPVEVRTPLALSVRAASVGVLILVGAVLGIGASLLAPYTVTAAEQLMDPQGYISAVLANPGATK